MKDFMFGEDVLDSERGKLMPAKKSMLMDMFLFMPEGHDT